MGLASAAGEVAAASDDAIGLGQGVFGLGSGCLWQFQGDGEAGPVGAGARDGFGGGDSGRPSSAASALPDVIPGWLRRVAGCGGGCRRSGARNQPMPLNFCVLSPVVPLMSTRSAVLARQRITEVCWSLALILLVEGAAAGSPVMFPAHKPRPGVRARPAQTASERHPA